MNFQLIGDAGMGVIIMIALDVAAGLTAAASRGEIDSTKLRMGLFHKVGLILAFALAVVLEYEEHVVPIGLSVPLVMPVASYIIIMEACSVYENVRLINPDFRFEKFEDLFKDNKEEKHE